jgi:hypothetical protein
LFSTQKNYDNEVVEEVVYKEFDSSDCPFTEEEWSDILSGRSDMLIDFTKERLLSSVFTFGIEDEIRGKVWCHLLHAEEL